MGTSMKETVLWPIPIFMSRLGVCLGDVSRDILVFLQVLCNVTVLADGKLQASLGKLIR